MLYAQGEDSALRTRRRFGSQRRGLRHLFGLNATKPVAPRRTAHQTRAPAQGDDGESFWCVIADDSLYEIWLDEMVRTVASLNAP